MASPEPKNCVTGTSHLVHGCCSHLLKMVRTVTTAKEELNIAPHGLEDLLAVSCREKETPQKGSSHCQPLLSPLWFLTGFPTLLYSAMVPSKVPHVPAYDTGLILPCLLLPFWGSLQRWSHFLQISKTSVPPFLFSGTFRLCVA